MMSTFNGVVWYDKYPYTKYRFNLSFLSWLIGQSNNSWTRAKQAVFSWPTTPVSYTHLDVYKRQVRHWPFADYPGANRFPAGPSVTRYRAVYMARRPFTYRCFSGYAPPDSAVLAQHGKPDAGSPVAKPLAYHLDYPPIYHCYHSAIHLWYCLLYTSRCV